jgi:hypothetical protein
LICHDVAKSFGDFVLLVNPAFEGSIYEPLFDLATNRCYPTWQRPIMMIVTSSADDATRTAFPFGRRVSTLFERKDDDQVDSILRTVGHHPRYRTHELEWAGNPAAEVARKEPVAVRRCDCEALDPTERFEWWAFVAHLERQIASMADTGRDPREDPAPITADVTDGGRVYTAYGDDVVLVGDRKYAANYPYLVVTAAPEIIPDHNSIYTEPFIRFLHSFFIQHIALRRTFESDGCVEGAATCTPGGTVPCEQSCRLPGGGSCSGRWLPVAPSADR